ncbi:ComEC/Rec2 family competence protein [Leptospira noguchii]|uniref:ComEC/Rec2 family competence protein n=1 Tax=Leptospira noguchii TaxID=28182 RepID=UPI0012F6DB69|nr:MBL fold metallo-hydrolase [Leptospira noguchii]
MLRVYYKDVGQGDSTLVIGPNGSIILIDCNFSTERDLDWLDELIPENDEGEKEISYLIITHPHEDHIRGVGLLRKKYRIKALYESGHRLYVSDEDREKYSHYYDMLNLIQKIKKENLEHKILKAGDVDPLRDEPKIKANVLSPTKTYLESEKPTERDIHEQCLVIRMEYEGYSFLFTGDSNMTAWKDHIIPRLQKLGQQKSLKSTVLHASHHSSYTFYKPEGKKDEDAYLEHIDLIKPLITIISVGAENRYNHPDEDALEIYKEKTKRDKQVFMTKDHGTLFLRVDDQSKLHIMTENMQKSIHRNNIANLKIDASPEPKSNGKYDKEVEIKFKAKISNKPTGQVVSKYRWTVQNNSWGGDDHHEWYEGQNESGNEYNNKTAYTGEHILLCEVFNSRNKILATAWLTVKVE